MPINEINVRWPIKVWNGRNKSKEILNLLKSNKQFHTDNALHRFGFFLKS
jgi:hypothetical protein